MANYEYHFYDFSSRQHIDTLPLESPKFGWELGGVGTLTGEFPLYADDLPARRVIEATYPYRTKVYVSRDDALIWGGWIHTEPAYNSATGRLTITAEESLGYFARRFMPTLTYSGADQLAIFRGVVAALQAEPGGDMWIELDDTVASGVLRDRTYSAFDRSPALTALVQLSEVINGFEFGVQTTWIGDVPHELLRLGYPRLGRAGAASGLVWEYDRFLPGEQTIEDFTWAGAGGAMATRCFASTETDEGVQLSASASRPDLIAEGYPLMEHAETFDGVEYTTTLQQHADALLAYRSAPRIAARARAKAQDGLEIGDFFVGDEVLCRISDHRFPTTASGEPGFVDYLRIVGVDVTPGPEGEETYEFVLAEIASYQ